MQPQHKGCFKCNSLDHFAKNCKNDNFIPTGTINIHHLTHTDLTKHKNIHKEAHLKKTAKLDDLAKTLTKLINKHKSSIHHPKYHRASQHDKSSNNKLKSHSRHNHSKSHKFHQSSKHHYGNYTNTNAINIDDELSCTSCSWFLCRREGGWLRYCSDGWVSKKLIDPSQLRESDKLGGKITKNA